MLHNGSVQTNYLATYILKSSFLLFHQPQKKIDKITLKIYGNVIPEKKSAKYLGVYLDKHLTWTTHINHINLKVTKATAMLSKVRHFIPSNILRMLYFSLCKPHIDYCFSVWSSTSQTNLEPIAIAMRKAIRILSFRAPDAHSDPLFITLKFLNFQQLHDFNINKLIWNVYNNKLPNFIGSNFKLSKYTKFDRKLCPTYDFSLLCKSKVKRNSVFIKGG